jgi:hypothetical protein
MKKMEKTLNELIAERDGLLDNIKAAIESGDDNAFGKAVNDLADNCLASVAMAASGITSASAPLMIFALRHTADVLCSNIKGAEQAAETYAKIAKVTSVMMSIPEEEDAE